MAVPTSHHDRTHNVWRMAVLFESKGPDVLPREKNRNSDAASPHPACTAAVALRARPNGVRDHPDFASGKLACAHRLPRGACLVVRTHRTVQIVQAAVLLQQREAFLVPIAEELDTDFILARVARIRYDLVPIIRTTRGGASDEDDDN